MTGATSATADSSAQRRNHYFVRRPGSGALYAELLASILPLATMLDIWVEGTPVGSRERLLEKIAVDELPARPTARAQVLRKFATTPIVVQSILGARAGFDEYPGDMALRRGDSDVVLSCVCAAHSVRIRMDDIEYADWRQGRSPQLLALLDMPDPGKVIAVGPFLHARHDPIELRESLAHWSPPLRDSDRYRIADYLDSATVVVGGRDSTDVRTEAIIEGGHQLLSDGVWAWCREASHYAREYGIGIPAAFVEHSRELGFVPPQISEEHEGEINDYIWERYDPESSL